MNIYRIGIIGLGFVGLTLATVLANEGFNVIGIDTDENKIDLIKRGKTPFYEIKLEDYLVKTINKNLFVSSDYNLLRGADIVFIAVGTPTKESGEQDLTYIKDSVKKLGIVWRNIDSYKLLVIKSTVLPGTSRELARIFAEESNLKLSKDFGVVFNPEFLREGYAVEDTEKPSRVVIGCIDQRSCIEIRKLWEEFYRRKNIIVPIIEMSLEEAELVKYASNIYLAMRISYVNTIANICEKIPNCDVKKVLEATGLDPRIGLKYFEPGLGYGGSCLPKDVKAFIKYSVQKLSYEPVLIKAVDEVNNNQPYRALDYLIKEYSDLSNKTIGVLGLAFKPNTDDIRESVSLKIIEKLLEIGAIVKVHDPKALDNARKYFEEKMRRNSERVKGKIIYCNEPLDVVRESDAVIIATAWDEYRRIKPDDYIKYMKNPVVIDGRRIYNYREFIEKNIKFYAIGLSTMSSY